MKNKRAVVVYLDFSPEQFKMFKMLVRSFEVSQIEYTDLVVFYAPYYEIFKSDVMQINKTCSVHFIEKEDKHLSNISNLYPYIKSIACMKGENWLNKYDYLLKSDVDTLLTSKWNQYFPKFFTTGLGGYNYDSYTKERLRIVGKYFGICKRDDYVDNIGSTWYGDTTSVLAVANLAVDITEYFANVEFKNFKGEWPSYFFGVISMYASEIAINHLIQCFQIDANNLDYYSTSTDNTNSHAHVHCWHVEENFSKHKFFDGKYDNINFDNLNLNVLNEFCLFCAITGNK